MILGVGAGWQKREHTLFGFDLGDTATRMARFAEGLEVVTRLFSSDEPITFEGRFYQLRGARLLPRPQHPGGPPLLIGGNGPKYTLPLAARYANIWNAVMIPPNEFREHSALLDTLLREIGRKPDEVKRTLMHRFQFGRNKDELEHQLSSYLARPEFVGKSMNDVMNELRVKGDVVGTPESVIEQIKRYTDVGVEELMLQWLDIDDIDGLRAFAKSVLPQV